MLVLASGAPKSRDRKEERKKVLDVSQKSTLPLRQTALSPFSSSFAFLFGAPCQEATGCIQSSCRRRREEDWFKLFPRRRGNQSVPKYARDGVLARSRAAPSELISDEGVRIYDLVWI